MNFAVLRLRRLSWAFALRKIFGSFKKSMATSRRTSLVRNSFYGK
jgi:hypothetical protein